MAKSCSYCCVLTFTSEMGAGTAKIYTLVLKKKKNPDL